jgi:hypothetical protein
MALVDRSVLLETDNQFRDIGFEFGKKLRLIFCIPEESNRCFT